MINNTRWNEDIMVIIKLNTIKELDDEELLLQFFTILANKMMVKTIKIIKNAKIKRRIPLVSSYSRKLKTLNLYTSW